MYRVGLTGNIASGKSAVSSVWRDLGAEIIDADQAAREAVQPGSPALDRIAAEFGPDVLDPDGTLDRRRLRDIVFRDASARRRLEAIVHPVVQAIRTRAERELGSRGVRLVVHEIPLLFEVGLQNEFDAIVLVDAPVPLRRRRLIESRGLDEARANAMIEAQMDPATKRDRADYIIMNDGTLDELAARAAGVWSELEKRAA